MEEFVLSMSLRLMRFCFSLVSYFANPHVVPYSHDVPEAYFELLRCVSAPGPLIHRREGTGFLESGFMETCLSFAGVQSCVAA
jgi:hypothetical protein